MSAVPNQASMLTRRTFVVMTTAGAGSMLLPHHLLAADVPRNDPASHLRLSWTAELAWNNVVDVTRIEGDGKYWDQTPGRGTEAARSDRRRSRLVSGWYISL